MSEGDCRGVLLGAGLSKPLADALANPDAAARGDTLFEDGGAFSALSALIGRPTTPMRETIAAALRACGA